MSGRIFIKICGRKRTDTFCKIRKERQNVFRLPFGNDLKAGIEMIQEYSDTEYPEFWVQDGARLSEFKELFGEHYAFSEERDAFDYVYNRADLASLSGKKYHGKRNHISAFSKQYDWRYAALTAGNVNDIRQCANEWYAENEARADKYLLCEKRGVEIMLQNAAALKIRGGIIYIGEKAVAFTLGSAVNRDVFDIHIEKSLAEYAEGYTVINREFAANELADYKYINREDDMGLDGLRQAKLSYHPAVMVKKYSAVKKVAE
ncbi:MAG: DUF2156 domain-containing protein [Oscillospiraceae bacterium]